MDARRNKQNLQRLYDEVMNEHHVDAADELITPDRPDHDPNLPPEFTEGRDGFKRLFEMFIEAFPDLSFHNEQMVAEGDLVAAHNLMSGTHRGAFMGIPPTGKVVLGLCVGRVPVHRRRADLGALGRLRHGIAAGAVGRRRRPQRSDEHRSTRPVQHPVHVRAGRVRARGAVVRGASPQAAPARSGARTADLGARLPDRRRIDPRSRLGRPRRPGRVPRDGGVRRHGDGGARARSR